MEQEDEDAIKILLDTRDEDLTDWEFHFLEDISGHDHLTEKQQQKLDEIWERHMDLNR